LPAVISPLPPSLSVYSTWLAEGMLQVMFTGLPLESVASCDRQAADHAGGPGGKVSRT